MASVLIQLDDGIYVYLLPPGKDVCIE